MSYWASKVVVVVCVARVLAERVKSAHVSSACSCLSQREKHFGSSVRQEVVCGRCRVACLRLGSGANSKQSRSHCRKFLN